MRFIFRVLVTVLAGSMGYSAKACDVCGGSVSNQGIGLLPQFSGHFAGLQYLHSHTESNYPSLFHKADEADSRDYSTVQLWGRYQLNKKIQLLGLLPYACNSATVSGQSNRINGIGDITLMASYALFSDKSQKQLLLVGAGIKLPSGTYTGITEAERSGIPDIQTGTGSWDMIVNINYTRRLSRFGYNAEASCLLTTANKYQYKSGNRFSTAGTLFYRLQRRNWTLLPQAGPRLEYALHDYDNYAQKWLNEQTGGMLCFAQAGCQAQYRNAGMKVQLSLPVYQRFAGGYVQSGMRSEVSLFILF